MKLLSIVVPCYNSAAYMDRCIKSLMPDADDVEIIIVDDGSFKDDTPQKADALAQKYPGIIRAVHQENKGHGGAVNTGIANAEGLFLKVVDSDDRLNRKAYLRLLRELRRRAASEDVPDIVFTNFVYDKQGARHKRVVQYRGRLPQNQIFSWDRFPWMPTWEYVLMHAVTYRTQILRDSGMVLPEHTFYVDNIFAFSPYPFAKKLLYLDLDLYRYFIGRGDQSVNESVMISRMDQQMRVNRIMFSDLSARDHVQTDFPKGCRRYMFHYLSIITMVSSVLCVVSGTPEHLAQKDQLWAWMKETDPALAAQLRTSLACLFVNLPGKAGRWFVKTGYRIARKFVGFN